jgi:hypothetical protein
MNKINILLTVFILLAGLTTNVIAQVEGQWLLTINPGSERLAILTIERTDGTLTAYLDGGPIASKIEGNAITMEADYRDGGGRLLYRHFTGTILEGSMSGTLVAPHNGSTGTWHAEPWTGLASQEPPAPVDFTGIWSRISAGSDKVHLDYTDTARVLVESYNYLDDPALRCISPGLARVSGWPYPVEIMQNEQQMAILYESFHEVRRIYFDGREVPDDLPSRAMGYSIGQWEGSVLVVESSLLKPAFIDLAGQPLSSNARITEHMTMSEDKQILNSLMSIEDPENYHRPITRFRQWRRTPETAILEYDCDPYPFFRGLELEGKLSEYWDKMRQQR